MASAAVDVNRATDRNSVFLGLGKVCLLCVHCLKKVKFRSQIRYECKDLNG